ncbi:unnamed protein product, partial [Musa banksii]
KSKCSTSNRIAEAKCNTVDSSVFTDTKDLLLKEAYRKWKDPLKWIKVRGHSPVRYLASMPHMEIRKQDSLTDLKIE